ncbi:MAG: flagellar assembly peptidoglycan hydrolase FlgJ, partial [Porticoccaceae bacterium]|nr:flagellar assembly peptidoglycan hydrolase FlgJ [Porticoccaceae bacterium]
VQMMTKAMRDATEDGGLFNSDEMKFHQSMFDQQISLHLSQSGGVGLAQVIERQLAGPGKAAETQELQPLEQAWNKARAALGVAANEPPARAPAEQFEPQNPGQFIQALWPHAQRAGEQLGVDAEVLVAQAALESGWGKHTIRDLDGRNSLNLFGIKADAQWQGDRATKVTLEYRDGIARKERASFRAYNSLEQLFDDYVAFLQKPRYQQVHGATNGDEFVQRLQDSGYATDPNYARKISALMQRDSFRAEVAQLKQGPVEASLALTRR